MKESRTIPLLKSFWIARSPAKTPPSAEPLASVPTMPGTRPARTTAWPPAPVLRPPCWTSTCRFTSDVGRTQIIKSISWAAAGRSLPRGDPPSPSFTTRNANSGSSLNLPHHLSITGQTSSASSPSNLSPFEFPQKSPFELPPTWRHKGLAAPNAQCYGPAV